MQVQLDKAFASLNALILERQLAWAAKRREAVKKASAEVPKGQWYFARLAEAEIQAAGGKAWRGILLSSQWEFLVKENVRVTIVKRDSQIIKALVKAGITEIPEFELKHTSDGVEGTFHIGNHTVNIKTIVAGGYNIQCLHCRTLVKVR